jgi:AraC family transcriptional regulator
MRAFGRLCPTAASATIRSPMPSTNRSYNSGHRPLRASSGLAIAATTYAANSVLDEHYHDGATISLVFRGGYTERVGPRHHECGPFAFVYKPPQIEHANRIGRLGLDALFAEIAPERFADVDDVVARIADSVCVTSARSRSLVAQAQREMRAELAGYELVLEGILLELSAVSARSTFRAISSAMPPWLIRAREYIGAHFRESIGLSDVARAAGVHPVHLAQTFRLRYGRTVGECVRELRVEFASRALGDREQSIGEIGLSAGFADHSHFARTFKAHTGTTPSQYRRDLQG